MIILVTGGVGYYQEEGQPAQIIREGDVVECAAGAALPFRYVQRTD